MKTSMDVFIISLWTGTVNGLGRLTDDHFVRWKNRLGRNMMPKAKVIRIGMQLTAPMRLNSNHLTRPFSLEFNFLKIILNVKLNSSWSSGSVRTRENFFDDRHKHPSAMLCFRKFLYAKYEYRCILFRKAIMVYISRTRLFFITSQRMHTTTSMNRASGSSTTDHPKRNVKSAKNAADRVHWGQQSQNKFTELGITTELYHQTGGVRFRQHVNPLKKELQIPTEPLDWHQKFKDPTLPLIVDVGAGYGRFLLALLKNTPGYNGLGMEIRQPVIERANKWSESLDLNSRCQFARANATISFSHTVSTYPGPIDLVSIQYPDPMFKARHKKRRIVQKRLVEQISNTLKPGARVFLQTDVLDVAEDMRNHFEKTAGHAFELSNEHNDPSKVFHESQYSPNDEKDGVDKDDSGDDGWTSQWVQSGWLLENPLVIPTEREVHVLSQGLPVYRMLLVKK